MANYDSPGLLYDSGVLYDSVPAPQPTRKRMAKVRIGLKGLSREQIADKNDAVKAAMTGNANFTTPDPSLAALGTAGTTLRAKIAAIESAKVTLGTAVADGDAAAAVVA